MTKPLHALAVLFAASSALVPTMALAQSSDTARDTIFAVQQRFATELDTDTLRALDAESALALLSPSEREAMGQQFVQFDVNVPVTVYIARGGVEPFWFEDFGFEPTDLELQIRHETNWKVWKADFAAGAIGLGVNGLTSAQIGDSGEQYAVIVAPQNPEDTLEITGLADHYGVATAELDTPAWKDEPSRYFEMLPEELEGLTVVQLLRSRRHDGFLVEFARFTDFPSTPAPDQVVINLGADPRRQVSISWRTAEEIGTGEVHIAPFEAFDPEGDFETVEANAAPIDSPRDQIMGDYTAIDDFPGMLTDLWPEPANDPTIMRHTARLTDLEPGTQYTYVVGSDEGGWSDPFTFSTAPTEPEPFSFIYWGDVQHGFETWAPLVEMAAEAAPDAAFHLVAGDLVARGPERDDWDGFFAGAGNAFAATPIVPLLGNHEYNGTPSPSVYLDTFDLPENGAEGLTERTYAFGYGDALFIVLDANRKSEAELAAQTAWLEDQLANSEASWNIVAFHQPVYPGRGGQDEPELREAWTPLFDEYNVDLVLQGHHHMYQRTPAVRAGAPDPEGTIYVIANAGNKYYEADRFEERFGFSPQVLVEEIQTYQLVTVGDDVLSFKAVDLAGNVVDSFDIAAD